jgi:hypothetical protein
VTRKNLSNEQCDTRNDHPSCKSPRWREPELARWKALAEERRRNKYFKVKSREYDDNA